MDEPTNPDPARPPRLDRTDLGLVLVLLLLGGLVRGALIARTQVVARDGIGYIRYALMLESMEYGRAMRANEQHPGYPLSILAVSWPVRAALGSDDPAAMQLSAQAANGLAGTLLVIPMYLLGRRMFDRGVGFWAALLFQCLPSSSRVLSDGLSEGLYLLAATTGVYLLTGAVRTRSLRLFAAAGSVFGVAYLTRVEGAVLFVAALGTLLVVRDEKGRGLGWRTAAPAGAVLLLGGLIVTAPYMHAVGSFTTKRAAVRMLDPGPRAAADPGVTGGPLFADAALPGALLAEWSEDFGSDGRVGSVWWGFRATMLETSRCFLYLLWIPALITVGLQRRLFLTEPGRLCLLIVAVFQILALWRMAVRVGYVSDRHLLMVLLCGSYSVVYALRGVPGWLVDWWQGSAGGHRAWFQRTTAVGVVLLTGVHALGLSESIKPLHPSRVGFREAGLWLAAHAAPDDEILDPFSWANYYAGRVMQHLDGQFPMAAPGRTRYIVLDERCIPCAAADAPGGTDTAPPRADGKPQHPHKSFLPNLDLATRFAANGRLVFVWPAEKHGTMTRVMVFADP